MALRSILSTMISRRMLVQYGRRSDVLWRLTAVTLVAAILAQLGPMAVTAAGLVGLLLVWEMVGRVASSYSEVGEPELRQNVQQRMLSFVAGLSTSISFLVLTIIAAGWSVAETDGALALLVVGSSILAGWLVLNLLRQGWRIAFAILGLAAVAVFGSWSVVMSFKHPQAVLEPAIVVWVRLLALFGFVAVMYLWANPIGQRTKWVSRLMNMAFIIPALTAWALWVNPPVGHFETFSEIPKFVWFVGIGVGVAVLLILRMAQIIKPGVGVRRLTRVFRDRRTLNVVPISTTMTLGAFPSILLAASGSWMQWSIVTAFFVLTVLAKVTLHRQMTPARRRKNPPMNGSGKGLSSGNSNSRSSDAPVLTLASP